MTAPALMLSMPRQSRAGVVTAARTALGLQTLPVAST
jgi:hypothetical protein